MTDKIRSTIEYFEAAFNDAAFDTVGALLLPRVVVCPVCGEVWQEFIEYGKTGVECPECGAEASLTWSDWSDDG